eukprot:Colp12_sorted_trinity150504_noHs@30126
MKKQRWIMLLLLLTLVSMFCFDKFFCPTFVENEAFVKKIEHVQVSHRVRNISIVQPKLRIHRESFNSSKFFAKQLELDSENEDYSICKGAWQAKYADFHTKVLQGLLPPRFLIVSCNGYCGGLGNMIQTYEAALVLALVSKRALLLRFDQGLDLGQYWASPYIEWDYRAAKQRGILKGLNTQLSTIRDFSEVNLHARWTSDMVYWNIRLPETWSMIQRNPHHSAAAQELGLPPLLQNNGCLQRYLFSPLPYLEDLVGKHRPENVAMVGMHLRLGDKDLLPGQTTAVPPQNSKNDVRLSRDTILRAWKCAENLLRSLNETTKGHKVSLFLATDSVKIATEARRRFGDLLVETEGAPVHTGRTVDDPKKIAAGRLKAVLDYVLLTRSDVIMVPTLKHSSFSAAAARQSMREPVQYLTSCSLRRL